MATSTAPRRTSRHVTRPKRGTPPIRLRDFRDHLLRHAAEIAPADVTALVAQAPAVRRRAATDGKTRPAFRSDVELALALLGDHVAGRIPHVPYRTVTLLAAALFYYLDPVDVIPDFVPGVGTADDALVLAYASREGADGIRRYRAWRELEDVATKPRRGRSRAR